MARNQPNKKQAILPILKKYNLFLKVPHNYTSLEIRFTSMINVFYLRFFYRTSSGADLQNYRYKCVFPHIISATEVPWEPLQKHVADNRAEPAESFAYNALSMAFLTAAPQTKSSFFLYELL